VLGLPVTEGTPPAIVDWQKLVARLYSPEKTVTIALVGKYIELHDAYLSVVEALLHAGIFHHCEVCIDWVDAETLSSDEVTAERLKAAAGIIVPGGFGDRGIEGMIRAAKYARSTQTPYFGVCLGMQVLVIEYARNVMRLEGAHSTEMDGATSTPVIDLLPDQNGVQLGGTLRRGKYECAVSGGSLAAAAYGESRVWERHRHRYEFNNRYRDACVASGLRLSGVNPERDLVEIVEVPGNPWMLGVQFHPEFKSRPNRAHPLFRDFVGAAGRSSV
jgi:CTP synthase